MQAGTFLGWHILLGTLAALYLNSCIYLGYLYQCIYSYSTTLFGSFSAEYPKFG